MGGGRRPRLWPRLAPELMISHRTSTIVGGRVFVDGHACARDHVLLGFPSPCLWAQMCPREFDVRVAVGRTRSVTDSDMHDADTQFKYFKSSF